MTDFAVMMSQTIRQPEPYTSKCWSTWDEYELYPDDIVNDVEKFTHDGQLLAVTSAADRSYSYSVSGKKGLTLDSTYNLFKIMLLLLQTCHAMCRMLTLMDACNCLDYKNFFNVIPNPSHNASTENFFKKFTTLLTKDALCTPNSVYHISS